MIVTEKAVEAAKKAIVASNLQEDSILRVTITPNGCSGFMYGLNFALPSEITEDEVVIEQHGLKVVTSQVMSVLLEETTVDYFEGETQAGFTFKDNTPPQNSCGSCGCGSKRCN